MGGVVQWSNILGGVELIRRKLRKEAYGITFTLLTTSEGKKMGKTEKGAVWLDPEKTSPYEFYQYWRNVDDADVVKCLKLLTFVPVEQIETYEGVRDSRINEAKELLAYEITKEVHGEAEASKARDTARALFSQNADAKDMPTATVPASAFADGKIGVLDLLLAAGIIPSKGEGRRLIAQRGVTAAGAVVEDSMQTYALEEFSSGEFIVKKGKKVFVRILVD